MTAAASVLRVNNDTTLHVYLFCSVSNAAELRGYLSSESKERDMALINAGMVASLFQVHLAAFKALEAATSGRLTTKTLHSELVYYLAGSDHVGESFKRCGIHDDTQNVLVALFNATPDDDIHVHDLCKGTPTPIDRLPALALADNIQKAYKLTQHELQCGSLEDCVVAKMAAREC